MCCFLILFLSLWLTDLQYWAVTTKRHSWTEKVRCLPCWRSCGLKMRRSKGWGRTRRTEPASCRMPSSHMFRARVRDPTAAPRNETEMLHPQLSPCVAVSQLRTDRTDKRRKDGPLASVAVIYGRYDCDHAAQDELILHFLNEIIFNIKNIKMKVFFPIVLSIISIWYKSKVSI